MTMYIISKQFHFSASHQLPTLPEGHPCKRLHGHNYVVEVVLQAEALDEHGFVIDYGDLKPFKQMIDDTLDHRHLNDVLPCTPSSENLARYLYDWAKARWPQVAEMRVSETPRTWAVYRD
jgi:6-pyruvoyltetrahydropterin/6-carboxytetrahydropterin synthase